MTTTPTWRETDDTTGSLLDLLADDGTVSTDYEWQLYLQALRDAATPDGVVRPNALRPLVAGRIKPCRIGSFARRAVMEGVVAYTGEWEVSDDRAGKNSGKPCRVMRLLASP